MLIAGMASEPSGTTGSGDSSSSGINAGAGSVTTDGSATVVGGTVSGGDVGEIGEIDDVGGVVPADAASVVTADGAASVTADAAAPVVVGAASESAAPPPHPAPTMIATAPMTTHGDRRCLAGTEGMAGSVRSAPHRRPEGDRTAVRRELGYFVSGAVAPGGIAPLPVYASCVLANVSGTGYMPRANSSTEMC